MNDNQKLLSSLTQHIKEGGEVEQAMIAPAVEALLDETVPEADRADFLAALHRRGETEAEIAGFVECLLGHAIDPGISEAEAGGPLLDVCGTGGDRLGLFNVSTCVMFVAAACGARVVKHGNRGITSKSGGADVLEALGVPVALPPEKARESLLRHGAAFLFAPHYHPAFKAVAPVRKMISDRGETSIFNILGPLLNPARPSRQLVGLFDPDQLETYAGILARVGRELAWAASARLPGHPYGMDEISIVGPTEVVVLDAGEVTRTSLAPDDFGLPVARLADLLGGDAATNARILYNILAGDTTGARRDIVVANAAAALLVAGLVDALPHGVELAERALRDKTALRLLDTLRTA